MADAIAAAPSAPTTNTTPEAAAPATVAAKMYKLKVDGQELELPESEVISLAQQGKSASKRFQEAAAAKKEAEQIVNYLKSNPKEAFQRLGIDVRKFSEDTLLEFIQHEKMTPEQKKSWENEQELKKYRDKENADKEKAEKDRMAQLEQHHMQNYDAMFVQALTESGLPKTPYTIKRMAELTLVNVRKKLDLEPAQLAKLVREDYIAEQKALYGSADGDALLELLGKDAVKRLSKAQLAKYKAGKTNNGVAQASPAQFKESKTNPVSAWKAMQKKTRSLL